MSETQALIHGTEKQRMETVPRFGRPVDQGQVSIDLIPASPFEVHFKADRDTLTLPFVPTSIWGGFNSDKRGGFGFVPGQIGIHSTGCETHTRTQTNATDLVAFYFPREFRNRVLSGQAKKKTAYEDGIAGVFTAIGAQTFATTVRQMHLSGMIDSPLVAESLAVTLIRSTVGAVDGNRGVADEAPRTLIDAAKLSRLRDYIMADLTRDLSLDELSSLAGISPFHFARAFKQATGLSPHQYVLELRLTRAREELAGGKNTLADIAYGVGFSSQAHMTDVFKKRLGVTPGRYRKGLAA